MKFIIYLSKRILLLFIGLIIPTAVAFVSYGIIKSGINPYNVGIRSIFNLIISQLPIIIFTSYTLAIIFSIVLLDKTRINNLFFLHLPPIIITFIILSIFFIFNIKSKSEKFFITSNKNIQIGINTVFNQNTFNDTGNKIIYISYKNKKLVSFLYNKSKDSIIPIKKVSFTKKEIEFYSNSSSTKIMKIKYIDLPQKNNFLNNKLIKRYNLRLEKLTKNIKKIYYQLSKKDKLIFLSSFVLSFIIFIVPLSFLINDGGWGITGLIGSAIILAILPLLYNITFTMEYKFKNLFSLLGKYDYMICPIGFFILGFLTDIFIKISHKAEV